MDFKGEVDVRLGLLVALGVIVSDQFTKYFVLNLLLDERAGIVYSSFFNVVRAWNTGVSFSMFNNYGNLGAIVLSVIAFAIVAFLVYWLRSEKSRLAQVSLGFIIGGALGNVIDRVRFGAVFDFLDFHIGENHWPAFNLADSFICVGATLLIAQSLFEIWAKKEVKNEN